MNLLLPPYRLIRQRLDEGKVIPFLGAGASLSQRDPPHKWGKAHGARPLTSSQLAHLLAEKTHFPRDENEPDLTTAAQYYDVVAGRPALSDELHGIFDQDFPVTPLHRFLASLDRPLLIVTTNYDDLIERAFKARGRPYDLVVHTTNPRAGNQVLWLPHGQSAPQDVILKNLDIDLDAITVIYKMHGTVDRGDPQRDQYVITENDYIDFLTRMTRHKAIPAIFSEPFSTRHFLFLGYGLHDWNLRVVLNGIENHVRWQKCRSWAIQRHPSRVEQRFWQERGVEVYGIPIQEFVQKLISS